MTFGRTLQELTRLCGVKRCNLADALGYDPSYISRWINGVKHPSLRSNDALPAQIAALPTLVLLLNKLFFPEQDTLFEYRFISGSAYPFIQTFIPQPDISTMAWEHTDYRQIDSMPALFPALMLVYYAVIPAVTQFGWYVGFNDKFNKENIMYK